MLINERRDDNPKVELNTSCKYFISLSDYNLSSNTHYAIVDAC